MNHSEIVSFLWGVADLIRDTFKRGKYQDVILPLTVLRRLDSVLAPTKAKVLEVQARYRGEIENLDPLLRRASGFAFYNTSQYDFRKLLADAPDIAAEPPQIHRRVQPQHARGAGQVRLRQHHLEAGRVGPAVPGHAALRRPESGPPPGVGRQLHDGHDLRGAHPEVQRGAERKPRRALHPAGRRPPDGGPAAGRRRGPAPHRGRGAHRLRPLLRIGRHAHHRQGAHHSRRDARGRTAAATP